MTARIAAVVVLVSAVIGLAIAAHPVTVDASLLDIDQRTGLRNVDDVVFTGVAITKHQNGQRLTEEPFVDGRRHGTLRRWFADGQLAFSSVYVDGRREGETQSWWQNGHRRSQSFYVDDQPHGAALSWYRSGEKSKRYNYVAGQPVGLQQGWRKNGKLYTNFEYRNGRAYGLRNANLCVELEDENLVVQN